MVADAGGDVGLELEQLVEEALDEGLEAGHGHLRVMGCAAGPRRRRTDLPRIARVRVDSAAMDPDPRPMGRTSPPFDPRPVTLAGRLVRLEPLAERPPRGAPRHRPRRGHLALDAAHRHDARRVRRVPRPGVRGRGRGDGDPVRAGRRRVGRAGRHDPLPLDRARPPAARDRLHVARRAVPRRRPERGGEAAAPRPRVRRARRAPGRVQDRRPQRPVAGAPSRRSARPARARSGGTSCWTTAASATPSTSRSPGTSGRRSGRRSPRAWRPRGAAPRTARRGRSGRRARPP